MWPPVLFSEACGTDIIFADLLKGPDVRLFLVLALILAALAAVFSLQNAQPVSVNFLKWSFDASLVIVLVLTFAAGAISAFLVSIPWRIRVMRELSGLKKNQRDKTGV